MGAFLIYMMKVAVCQTAFYLLYKLLLSRDTYYGFNRVVLLSMIVASLVLPLINLPSEGGEPLRQGVAVVEQMVIEADVVPENESQHLTVIQIIALIYIIGVVCFFVRGVVSTVSLKHLIGRGRLVKEADGVVISVLPDDVSPFSCFRHIVISETDYACNPREILTHERAHIARGHSFDLLFCNLLIAFQWFNPSIWLIKAELQCVHEYEADAAVLSSGINAADYQLLLIRKAVGEKLFALANNLNQASLKKRINMMLSRRSNPWKRAKVAFVVPLVVLALTAFGGAKAEQISREIEQEGNRLSNSLLATITEPENETKNAAVQNRQFYAMKQSVSERKTDTLEVQNRLFDKTTTEGSDVDAKVFDVVEQPPRFPGGMAELNKYIRENIKTPESVIKNGNDVRVIVQFVVDKDGSVHSPKVYNSTDKEAEAEAMRVVSAMPKWIPGLHNNQAVRVKYTMPIRFSQPQRQAERVQSDVAEPQQKGKLKDAGVIIDGRRATMTELMALDSKSIKSITVIKDKAAIAAYGDEKVNSIIEITTKTK